MFCFPATSSPNDGSFEYKLDGVWYHRHVACFCANIRPYKKSKDVECCRNKSVQTLLYFSSTMSVRYTELEVLCSIGGAERG